MNQVLICLALRYLDQDNFYNVQLGHIWRKPLARKTASLIAHDRVLNKETAARGLPKYFIT